MFRLLMIILAVSLVMCAVGFKKYVYFMSIGYGASVAGIGVTLVVFMLTGQLDNSWYHFIFPILFVLYGFRLSGFLAIREFKNAAYKKTLDEVAGDSGKMPLFVKLTIWLGCAVLYQAQTISALLRPFNHAGLSAFLIAGLCVSVVGVILESVADKQKSAQKKVRPDMVATKGLYRMVRCPNYFGEILFWTGVFVSGLDTYMKASQWVTACLGFACIVLVMFNGAQRLEKRQNARYGSNKEYIDYANKTPIIIPLLPIYHLNKTK